jgi:hypothetical protein
MNYWIFKCNRELYDLDGRLNDPEPSITWAVTRYKNEIQAGDIVFIWQVGDDRGIRAVMQIDRSPAVLPEPEVEQRYAKEAEGPQSLRAVGTLIRRDLDLTQDEVEEELREAGIERFSLTQGVQQGTNFRLSVAEGEALLRLVGEKFPGTRA